MRFFKQLVTGFFVLIPLIFSVFIPLTPTPVTFNNARKTAYAASITGDKMNEVTALQTELNYTPWSGDTWQRLGRLQLDLGKYADAIGSFSQVRSQGKLSPEGMLWMADALISNHEPEKARDLLREFSTMQQVDAFVFLQAALMQRSLNDTYGALATLLKGYGIDPQNSEINYQIGLQLSATEPDRALPFLDRAAKLDPVRKTLCDALVKMITGSASMGQSADRYLYIGQMLSTYGEWDVAQRSFQKATDLDPQNGVAWALLAEAAQQNNQDGTEFITKAQKFAPNAEMVNGLSALYYRRQGKSELALTFLQKALMAKPSALVWEIEIGNTYAGMGDLVSALAHYQLAVQINPQDWAPWRALAVFCITRNYEMLDVGLPAARQALKLNEGSPALMDLLGTALMITNDLDEAEKYFLQADGIDPHQSAILIHLGQLYLARGEKQKAFVYLRQASDYAKENRLREMANRILSDNGG